MALEESADDLGPQGWDVEYGWGLLNVTKAINYKITGDLTGDLIVNIDSLKKWITTIRN